MTTLTTPIELTTPADQDHGLTQVNDCTGAFLHYLHEVSYRDGNKFAEDYLKDAGYTLRHTGWIHRELGQMWTANKLFPQEVANW